MGKTVQQVYFAARKRGASRYDALSRSVDAHHKGLANSPVSRLRVSEDPPRELREKLKSLTPVELLAVRRIVEVHNLQDVRDLAVQLRRDQHYTILRKIQAAIG